MKYSSALFTQRAIELYMKGQWPDKDTYDVRLALYILCETESTDTIKKAKLRGFLNRYIRSFTLIALTKVLDSLHEDSYVWIGSERTVTLTAYGKKQLHSTAIRIREYQKNLTRPVLRGLYEGKLSANGEVVTGKNILKKSPTAPYTGVLRHSAYRWFAYVTQNEKRTPVGTFKTAIGAAKARDAYIEKHKLFNNRKSL